LESGQTAERVIRRADHYCYFIPLSIQIVYPPAFFPRGIINDLYVPGWLVEVSRLTHLDLKTDKINCQEFFEYYYPVFLFYHT